MKQRIYIETPIPSYLTARTSNDILAAAHQQITGEWWSLRRHAFALFTSELVLEEAASGDPEAAGGRLAMLQGMPLLDLTPEVRVLARHLLAAGLIPAKAADDALHLAFATAHGMDFLLTWNCRHIANPLHSGTVNGRLRACGTRSLRKSGKSGKITPPDLITT